MIKKRDLGALDFIAEGAAGRVSRVVNGVPGYPSLAYKELRSDLSAQVRQQTLRSMTQAVAFRDSLGAAERAELDEFSTWPLAMVEDGGTACGLVMPLIPPEFFLRTAPQVGPPKDLVFELSWLCAKDSQVQVLGIDRSGVSDLLVRLALLARLCYAVGRLHAHGLVYGDLSLKNAALAVHPPRVKLLDCDAVAAVNDPGRVQLNSPFFHPPELVARTQTLQDDRTDVYKLALCVVRGLQQGQGATQASSPAKLASVLDQQAIDVLTRAVGTDRAARPTAKELYDSLEQALLARLAPPVLTSATLSRTAMLRGLDVEVVWESTGGRQVRILGANGLEVVLPDPGISPARYVITPAASGDIVVEVDNNHGSVELVAGTVSLYDLPQFQLNLTNLPRPVMPRMPAVVTPSMLPAVPRISLQGPRVVVPALGPVADAMALMRSATPPEPAGTRSVRSQFDPNVDRGRLAAAVSAATRRASALLGTAAEHIGQEAARRRAQARQWRGGP